jgi:hypothetical protein
MLLGSADPLVPEAILIFWQQMTERKVWHFVSKSEPKLMPLAVMKPKSVASRPLDIHHMGLISDVASCCWVLLTHWCQTIPIFDSSWLNNVGTSLRATLNQN